MSRPSPTPVWPANGGRDHDHRQIDMAIPPRRGEAFAGESMALFWLAEADSTPPRRFIARRLRRAGNSRAFWNGLPRPWTRSTRAHEFGGVKRLERVDCLDRLHAALPLEEPQHDLVGQEINNGEAVLLDRLELLFEIEMGGGEGAGAAPFGGPTGRPRADRSRQDRVDRVGPEVERAGAQHAA